MLRLSLVLCILAVFLPSYGFLIVQQKQAINWPFTTCGSGPWKMNALTLSAQPTRNSKDDIIAVLIITMTDWRSQQLCGVRPCRIGCEVEWTIPAQREYRLYRRLRHRRHPDLPVQQLHPFLRSGRHLLAHFHFQGQEQCGCRLFPVQFQAVIC